MGWGMEDSIGHYLIGHYLDLGSAVLGVTLSSTGYCLYALTIRTAERNPAANLQGISGIL
jgi:hypothetical protein